MLKAHQACIDLEKNVLRIRGREVQFLPEHELPEKARDKQNPEASESAAGSSTAGSSSSGGQPSFPGGGNTLGSAPAAGAQSRPAPGAARSTPASFPENDIQTLMGFGVARAQAIQALEAAGGNIDVAASLLF